MGGVRPSWRARMGWDETAGWKGVGPLWISQSRGEANPALIGEC